MSKGLESTEKEQTSIEGSLLEGPLSNEALPSHWQEKTKEAWKNFLQLPMPTRKEELWRYSSVNKLALDAYQAAVPVTEAALKKIKQSWADDNEDSLCEGGLIFANGELVKEKPISEFLQEKGVRLFSLENALKEDMEFVVKHGFQEGSVLGSRKFSSLHRAFTNTGTVLHVPRGIKVEKPIKIFHWLTEDCSANFPYTLVLAEEGSEVSVIEYFQTTEKNGGGFSCSRADMIGEQSAKVRHLRCQNLGKKALSHHSTFTLSKKDTSVMMLGLNLGGQYSRTENKLNLAGEGASGDMLSLTVGSADQEFDQRTYQEHEAPHTTSDLLYKNALCHESRSIFSGMIKVELEAQHTDAYQSNRNLLLSDKAQSNSLPGLEILANDVRCTHGATSGKIDPTQLFYMKSRGIPLRQARKLCVIGFFQDVLSKIDNKNLEEQFLNLIEKKLDENMK